MFLNKKAIKTIALIGLLLPIVNCLLIIYYTIKFNIEDAFYLNKITK